MPHFVCLGIRTLAFARALKPKSRRKKVMTNIDLTHLDKAEVLAALFNAASPAGMGFLAATGSKGAMTVADARAMLAEQQCFDYIGGRSCKVDFRTNEFDPWLYDRDNGGEGTAERIIERLRKTGAVNSVEHAENRRLVTTEREYLQPQYVEMSETVKPIVDEHEEMLTELTALHEAGIPLAPSDLNGRQYLDWASDQALRFFNEDPKKSIFIFLLLIEKHPNTSWIVSHDATPMLLKMGMQNRHEMERMMKGFAA